MAYARRTSHAGWYIYRRDYSTDVPDSLRPSRETAQLFVQGPYRPGAQASGEECFAYREIKAMLTSQDFSPIPGYLPEDRDIVAQAFAAFVNDVENEDGAA